MDKRVAELIEWIVKNASQSPPWNTATPQEHVVEVCDLLDAIGTAFDVPHFAIASTVNHVTQGV